MPGAGDRLAHEPAHVVGGATDRTARGTLRLLPQVRAHLVVVRSEEHTSELQSQSNLVCRLLLEKKKRTDLRRDSGVLKQESVREVLPRSEPHHAAARQLSLG